MNFGTTTQFERQEGISWVRLDVMRQAGYSEAELLRRMRNVAPGVMDVLFRGYSDTQMRDVAFYEHERFSAVFDLMYYMDWEMVHRRLEAANRFICGQWSLSLEDDSHRYIFKNFDEAASKYRLFARIAGERENPLFPMTLSQARARLLEAMMVFDDEVNVKDLYGRTVIFTCQALVDPRTGSRFPALVPEREAFTDWNSDHTARIINQDYFIVWGADPIHPRQAGIVGAIEATFFVSLRSSEPEAREQFNNQGFVTFVTQDNLRVYVEPIEVQHADGRDYIYYPHPHNVVAPFLELNEPEVFYPYDRSHNVLEVGCVVVETYKTLEGVVTDLVSNTQVDVRWMNQNVPVTVDSKILQMVEPADHSCDGDVL